MKKGTIRGFVVGMAVMALIISMVGSAMASFSKKSVEVDYCDIQIVVDGAPNNPTDVNGKAVEPFAYDGTTFLPVRAVAAACGYEVDWDQNTHTVNLTKIKYKTEEHVELYQEIAVPSLDNVLDGGKYESVQYLEHAVVYTYDKSDLPEENILIYDYESMMNDSGFSLSVSEADENNNMTFTFTNKETGMKVFLSRSSNGAKLSVRIDYVSS